MEVYIFLFDDFETMDAFGVADILGRAPGHFHMNYVSATGNIINSMQGVKVWTEPVDPETIGGIVVIPGGRGARRLLFQDEQTLRLVKRMVERAEYCILVANGSALPAQTGALFRRRIADCPRDENWKRMFMAGMSIIRGSSWVVDGKFYSSSNTLTGLAAALTLVADLVDLDLAEQIAGEIGYDWDVNDENAYQ